MKHKLKVWSRYLGPGERAWYAKCSCNWEPKDFVGAQRNGRRWNWHGAPSFDAAFAAGVAHQRDKKEVCTCG